VNVVWTIGAVQSLRSIRSYIQLENPKAANRVADKIEFAVTQLGMFPNSGRKGLRAQTRELVISNLPYVVVYRVKKDVQILRIFHVKQLRH
jgi:addiction module RelE/StbE family toxin